MRSATSEGEAAPVNPPRVPPGPRGLPGVGVLPFLARRPLEYLHDCARRFGDVFRVDLAGRGLTVVNHPELVSHFLVTNAERYVKGEINGRLEPFLGDGIPISEGEKWRRNRRLMNPMFARRRLQGLTEIMTEVVDRRLAGWERHVESGQPFDVSTEFAAITMQVMLRSMFSTSISDDEIDQAARDFRVITKWMAARMMTVSAPEWVPIPFERTGRAALARNDALVRRIIAERRAHPRETVDLLGMLVDARDDEGNALDDDELRDEVTGLLFGGFETTAVALTWAVARLDDHPDVEEAMLAEVDELGGSTPVFEDLARLDYTRAVFDEAQRLQGFVILSRTAREHDRIGGYDVRPGDLVGVCGYALHRHPRFWADPERYDPARFLGDRRAAMHRHQFLPFGVGARHCIGSNMAYMEAQLVLAMLAQRFHLRIVPGKRVEPVFHFSVGVKGGLPVTAHRRRATRV